MEVLRKILKELEELDVNEMNSVYLFLVKTLRNKLYKFPENCLSNETEVNLHPNDNFEFLLKFNFNDFIIHIDFRGYELFLNSIFFDICIPTDDINETDNILEEIFTGNYYIEEGYTKKNSLISKKLIFKNELNKQLGYSSMFNISKRKVERTQIIEGYKIY